MGFITKKIQNMYVTTPDGDVVLSAKSGEDPEIRPFGGSIESSADQMTEDGQPIKNFMTERSYIQGVFAFNDADMPKLQSSINDAKINADSDIPCNVVMTDGTIYSNSGFFAGPLVYNGTGTIELRFESSLDWIQS